MLAGGVCLACVPPLPNNSPGRAWPDSAPLSVVIYVCGVGSNAPSPELLRRDATKVHIILTDLWQGRCPASWTLLVVIIPFEPSSRPLHFYLFKGAALWREGPRSPYFTFFYQACLYVDGAVSFLVFPCKRKTGCPSNIWLDSLLESVYSLKACPALLPGAPILACPSDYLLRKGPILPDGVPGRPEAYRHAQTDGFC